MHATRQTMHLAPVDQPQSAHQIADRLFRAYTVDNGRIQLAGCALEDRLFVRVEVRDAGRSRTVYLDDHGAEVPGELVEALGMGSVAELQRSPQPPGPRIDQALQLAVRAVRRQASAGDPPEVAAAAALWCKFARGKVRFVVGDQSTDLPFSGWSRTLSPPPFICPHTGASTFHLAATDDGRLAAAEQIGTCDETGRRVLASELAACSLTGRRVLPELLEECPVSGGRVLATQMVACRACGQRVSPGVVRRRVCAACREPRRVDPADPRLARVLAKHPALARWPSWRLSETSTVLVLQADRWMKRLLVVVDRDTLDLRHLATANRILPNWRPVEPAEYDAALGT